MRARAHGRVFTLLEVLVVMAIIAVLAALLLPALGGATTRAWRGRAEADLRRLETALAQYRSETGSYPRRPGVPDATSIWKNDIAWATAALTFRPTPALGGGHGAPYGLGFQAESFAFVAHPDPAAGDDARTESPPFFLRALDERESPFDQLLQEARAPSKAGVVEALAFVDPWRSPYMYREWCSVPENLKTNARRTRVVWLDATRSVTVEDRPRSPTSFQLWSFGENGVNEWGHGDDVVLGGVGR